VCWLNILKCPGLKIETWATEFLAFALLSRSQILFGTSRTQEALGSIESSVAIYDKLISIPGATSADLCDAAVANGTLGDELGLTRDESMNDLAGALSAFRKDVDLNRSALELDGSSTRAKRYLAIAQLKIAETEMELDPEQALKDLRLGLQRQEALPQEVRDSLPIVRLRNALLLDQSDALNRLGEYSEGNAVVATVLESELRLVAADPQDLRALYDLQADYYHEAEGFETAADPALGASVDDRLRNLEAAEKPLTQEVALWEKMLKQSPSQEEWKPYQAHAQVHLGSIRSLLHRGGDSVDTVKRGIATLRALTNQADVSATILDLAAQDLLMADPASLRDPHLAVSCAERAVTLSHRKLPARLLTLAQAYRAVGQMEKSRATAIEGLALLPILQPGGVKPRIRRLLEIQAKSGS
jgi:hypothetical protein